MKTSDIVCKFREAAAKFPDRNAVIGNDRSYTYGEVERRAAAVANVIAERVKGPTLAMLHSNSPAFVPLFLGALWAGKTVAVLPTLAPPPLLRLMVMEAGAELVISSEEFVPRLMEVNIPCWIGDISGEADPTTTPLRPLQQEHAVMLYTSGTTGRPKAVMLSERNILDNVEGCRLATGFNSDQVMLAILPLFHAYGKTVTLLLPLITGATVVIPDRFVPRAVLQTIEQHKVSCLVAVPSQYRLLTKEPADFDCSSLWLCISGAERLPEQVSVEFEERFGKKVLQGYGATEMSPVVSFNTPGADRFPSVGKPLPNLEITIRDEDGKVLGAGEIGEVCIKGTAVMLGYYRDPEATAKKIRDGVLYSGDKGYLDADGYLYLSGRADDLVKVSGEKVYPSEVETALETIHGVDEAAVISFPDEKHGARLQAFVLLKADAQLDETALRNACKDMLEPHKVPRNFTFIQQMPRTITGKTDKRALAATAV
jgi:long-chain acyl-CoA synthetase